MSGTGMQQARALRRGETRRGGEKPRGRNAMPWCGSHGPMESLRALREWTAAGAGEGDPRRIEVRGRQDRVVLGARACAGDELLVVPFRVGRAEREVKAGGGCSYGNARACVGRDFPGAATGNGETAGGK